MRNKAKGLSIHLLTHYKYIHTYYRYAILLNGILVYIFKKALFHVYKVCASIYIKFTK